jgi:hypothetical protein
MVSNLLANDPNTIEPTDNGRDAFGRSTSNPNDMALSSGDDDSLPMGGKKTEGMESLAEMGRAGREMLDNMPAAAKAFPMFAQMETIISMLESIQGFHAEAGVQGVGGNIPDGTQVAYSGPDVADKTQQITTGPAGGF